MNFTMDGTDADGEWSDEEAVRSGSNTGVSETEQDDQQTVTIKRPQPSLMVTSSMSTYMLMASTDPLSSADPVNSILDKIDAEIEAMDMGHPCDSHPKLSTKPTRPGSANRSKANYSHHTYGGIKVPSLNLNKSAEQEDTDTGLGSASFRGDEGSNPERINGTVEVYSEAAMTDGLTDEDTIKNVDDVPSDLDSLVAQQIDLKFKEIMRKKKVPPDLPVHPGKPTATGVLSTRLRQRSSNRPSATMLSTGYGTDNDSVKTEDFEAKFMNMLIASDTERPTPETTSTPDKQPIKIADTPRTARHENKDRTLDAFAMSSVPDNNLQFSAKKDVRVSPSAADDDILQRLRNITDGTPATKTPAISLARPRSLSPTRLSLQRHRTSDNLRGVWDASRGSSQIFSWDDDFWQQLKRKGGPQSVTSSGSTFEEVESLCLSRSSADSRRSSAARFWDRWSVNSRSLDGIVNGGGDAEAIGTNGPGLGVDLGSSGSKAPSSVSAAVETGRKSAGGGASRKFTRQYSTSSTSTSWSSGPIGDRLSSDSGTNENVVDNLQSLIDSMELLNSQGGLDATDKLYLDQIFQRVMDWNNGKSSSETAAPANPTPKSGAFNRFMSSSSSGSRMSDFSGIQSSNHDYRDIEETLSSYSTRPSKEEKRQVPPEKPVRGETRRRRHLIVPEDEDKNGTDGDARNEMDHNWRSDGDVKPPSGSTSIKGYPQTLKSSEKINKPSMPSHREGVHSSKGHKHNDSVPRPSLAMFMSRNSLSKNASFDSAASPNDPINTGNPNYSSGNAERILMGLGFGFTEGFLPDRFLRDWYHKVSMAQELELQEREDGQEINRKVPPGPSSSNDPTPRPRGPIRRDSHISLASSSLDEAANLPPGNFGPDSKIQRLREYIANFSNNSGFNYDDRNAKMWQFANSRQKSLPIMLETLSEEEECRGRVPGVDPFNKEDKLKRFISDEMSNSAKSTTGSVSNQSIVSSNQSENESTSSVSDFKGHAFSKKPRREETKQPRNTTERLCLPKETTENQNMFSNNSFAENQSLLKHNSIKQQNKTNQTLHVCDTVQTDTKTHKIEHKDTHPPPAIARRKSSTQLSNDSLEVADIMQYQTHGQGDSCRQDAVGLADRGVTHKKKPIIKAVEPAMVSIVLEDVDEGNDRSLIDKSGLRSDSSLLSIPLSAQALSPIPQSPVTVIEVGLDNQLDSLDTEEGTGSSREADEDTGTSHRCSSNGCSCCSPDPNHASSSSSSRRRRSRAFHQDTVKRANPRDFSWSESSTSIDSEGQHEQIWESVVSKNFLGVPKDMKNQFSMTKSATEQRKDTYVSFESDNEVDSVHDKTKSVSFQRASSSQSNKGSGFKSPPSSKRKTLKRQKGRHSKSSSSCEESLRRDITENIPDETHRPTPLKSHMIAPNARYTSHYNTGGHYGVHHCPHHSVRAHSCRIHHHDTPLHSSNCPYLHDRTPPGHGPLDGAMKLTMTGGKNCPGSPDSAFKATRKVSGINLSRALRSLSETSDTDFEECPNMTHTSLKPKPFRNVSENHPVPSERSINRHSNFRRSSPLTFASDTFPSGKSFANGPGRVQSTSRAVQVDFSRNRDTRTIINHQSLFNSDNFYLACDRQVQCCLGDATSIGTSRFHKSTQTTNHQHEGLSRMNEGQAGNTMDGYSVDGGGRKNNRKAPGISKAINTVLCLIDDEHYGVPWGTEVIDSSIITRRGNELADGSSRGRFQLVDETLNQIEEELTLIGHKQTQRNQIDTKADSAMCSANGESKQTSFEHSAEKLCDLEMEEQAVFDVSNSKLDLRQNDQKQTSATSCLDRTGVQRDDNNGLQECIQKMDILNEMNAYLRPCVGMYRNEGLDVRSQVRSDGDVLKYQPPSLDVHIQGDDVSEKSGCPQPLSRTLSCGCSKQSNNENNCRGRRHSKLSRLKYMANSHDNSCSSLDIETDFMNAGDPLGSLEECEIVAPWPNQETISGNESHTDVTPRVKITTAGQPYQLCPHLPRYSYVADPSSSDNPMTDSEDTQNSSCPPFNSPSTKQQTVIENPNQTHGKLRRLWPLVSPSSKHPVLRDDGINYCEQDISSGDFPRSGMSNAVDNDQLTPDIVISPLVSFQMDFLRVPISPENAMSHASYPESTSKSSNSSNYKSLPSRLQSAGDAVTAVHTTTQKTSDECDEAIINRNEGDAPLNVKGVSNLEYITNAGVSAVTTNAPKKQILSSIDSLTSVSELDSFKKSVDGNHVLLTLSDGSFDVREAVKSQSDISAVFTDESAFSVFEDKPDSARCISSNVPFKENVTVSSPFTALRSHNTWEGSNFTYELSVTNRATLDSASDRSVAGSDCVEDIADSEVSLYRACVPRRDSESSYSDTGLDLIDGLSQCSIGSAGNQMETREITRINASPDGRCGLSPLVLDTDGKSSQTPTIRSKSDCSIPMTTTREAEASQDQHRGCYGCDKGLATKETEASQDQHRGCYGCDKGLATKETEASQDQQRGCYGCDKGLATKETEASQDQHRGCYGCDKGLATKETEASQDQHRGCYGCDKGLATKETEASQDQHRGCYGCDKGLATKETEASQDQHRGCYGCDKGLATKETEASQDQHRGCYGCDKGLATKETEASQDQHRGCYGCDKGVATKETEASQDQHRGCYGCDKGLANGSNHRDSGGTNAMDNSVQRTYDPLELPEHSDSNDEPPPARGIESFTSKLSACMKDQPRSDNINAHDDDPSSGDECDKEIGRINAPPFAKRNPVPLGDHLQLLTRRQRLSAFRNNELESPISSETCAVPHLAESSAFLKTFQAAELSTLIDTTETSAADSSPQALPTNATINPPMLGKAILPNAFVLSVAYDNERSEETSIPHQDSDIQGCPTTLMDEFEIMALFKNIQELDSSSLDTSSPRAFKLSQITEEETQSEDSFGLESGSRLCVGRYQSQPSSDTIVVDFNTSDEEEFSTSNDSCHQSSVGQSGEPDEGESEQESRVLSSDNDIPKLLDPNQSEAAKFFMIGDKDHFENKNVQVTPTSRSLVEMNEKNVNVEPSKDFGLFIKNAKSEVNTTENRDGILPVDDSCRPSLAVLESVSVANELTSGEYFQSKSHSTAHVTQRTILNFNVGGRKKSPEMTSSLESPSKQVSMFSIQIGDYRKALQSESPLANDEGRQHSVTTLLSDVPFGVEPPSRWISSFSLSSSSDGHNKDRIETNSTDEFRQSPANKESLLDAIDSPVAERKKRVTVKTMFSYGSEEGPFSLTSSVRDSSKTGDGKTRAHGVSARPDGIPQRPDAVSKRSRSREHLQLLHHQKQVQSSGGSESDSDLTSALRVDSDIDLRERDLALGRLTSDYLDDEESVKPEVVSGVVTTEFRCGEDNMIDVLEEKENVLIVPVKSENPNNVDGSCVSQSTTSSGDVRKTRSTPRVVVHQPSDDFQATHESSLAKRPLSLDVNKTKETSDASSRNNKNDSDSEISSSSDDATVNHWSVPKKKGKAGRLWTRRLQQRSKFLSPAAATAAQNISPDTGPSLCKHIDATDNSHPELDYLDILSKLNGSADRQKTAFLSPFDQRKAKLMMSPPPIRVTDETRESDISAPSLSTSTKKEATAAGNSCSNDPILRVPTSESNSCSNDPTLPAPMAQSNSCSNDHVLTTDPVPTAESSHSFSIHNLPPGVESVAFLDREHPRAKDSQKLSYPPTKPENNKLSLNLQSTPINQPLTLGINETEEPQITTIPGAYNIFDSPSLDPISEDSLENAEDLRRLGMCKSTTSPRLETSNKLYVKSSSVTSRDSGFESNESPNENNTYPRTHAHKGTSDTILSLANDDKREETV